MRPAKRQHRRCIGCEKTLLSFLGPSVGFWLSRFLCRGLSSTFQRTSGSQLELHTHAQADHDSGSWRGTKSICVSITPEFENIIDAPSSASAALAVVIAPNPGRQRSNSQAGPNSWSDPPSRHGHASQREHLRKTEVRRVYPFNRPMRDRLGGPVCLVLL